MRSRLKAARRGSRRSGATARAAPRWKVGVGDGEAPSPAPTLLPRPGACLHLVPTASYYGAAPFRRKTWGPWPESCAINERVWGIIDTYVLRPKDHSISLVQKSTGSWLLHFFRARGRGSRACFVTARSTCQTSSGNHTSPRWLTRAVLVTSTTLTLGFYSMPSEVWVHGRTTIPLRTIQRHTEMRHCSS